MSQREYGIDLVKILACFGVVSLHTLMKKQGIINAGIADASSLCIPLFFSINGYFVFSKANTSRGYVIKKIRNILSICLTWEILYSIAYFAVYHEIRNFLKSYILDFFQQGLFFHFWFLGSLIMLYVLLPLMNWIKGNELHGQCHLAKSFSNSTHNSDRSDESLDDLF